MPYYEDTSGGLHYLTADDAANGLTSLLPAGCTEITDAQVEAIQNPPLTLAQAQTQQCALIDAAYVEAVERNVTFKTAAGTMETFEADEASQTLIMQATQGYALAGATPSGFYWVAADNTQVTPFALADLQGLYQAMLSQGWVAFQKRQTLKAQINAATTVAVVQAISWS